MGKASVPTPDESDREGRHALRARGQADARRSERSRKTIQRPLRLEDRVEHKSPRSRPWLAASALLLVLGAVASAYGALTIARNERQQARQAFVASTNEISSRFQLAIQHEQDLVIGVGSFAVLNPDASEADFVQWSKSVRAFERYPELVGIATLTMVPASQLSEFTARATADPAGPLSADGTFQITPAGSRPYYCLATLSLSKTGQSTTPAGFDFCATSLGPALLQARDTGRATYLPYSAGKGETELVLGTPVYRDGVTPTTLQARRDAFLGWTGTSIVPDVVLDTAMEHHPSISMEVVYGAGPSKVTFRNGSVPAGAQSSTTDLHNGWHVVAFAPVNDGGVFDSRNALALLFGGSALFLLLASTIFLLGTGRSRAVLLVQERTQQLRHQAFHDALTGLPNRALILDRMDQMLARSTRDGAPLAVLFLDLDNFKDINDTLGHEAGDQLLVAVASRLAESLRGSDSVGRLGGDEFVVLADGSSLAAGAEAVAERLRSALRAPISISGGPPLTVTASVGIATDARLTPEELLRDADIALYEAKAAGKDCAILFSPAMQEAVDDHRYLDVDLHRAVSAGEFFLLYQPIVDLRTGTIKGVEALLRWRHPERGVVQPAEFISALEASGLIVSVGGWVLQEACRQGAVWQRGGCPLIISVNVAAAQLERDRIVDDVRSALDMSGLDPTLLTLEVTETSLMHDVVASAARLDLLKAIGVRIAIDDFGTGYSSMAYLQQFPIDVLKVDQSFVANITESEEAAALVHTLVQLGKALGIATTAEGIETNDQRKWLTSEGVDGGQGYLFSQPVDAAAIAALPAGAGEQSELVVAGR